MLGRGGPSIGKWGRRIDANDVNTALTVNQRSTGDILDVQDAGVSVLKVADGGAITVGGSIAVADDILFKLGTDGDGAMLNKSAGLAADTALTSVLIGTVEAQAIETNSLMIANATSNGDIALYTNKGGHSQMGIWLDGSAGDTALLAASGASVDIYIAGVKEIDYATGALAFQQATIISTAATTLTLSPSTIVNITKGFADTLTPSLSANNDSLNPAPSATTVTMVNTKSFTGIIGNLVLPAIVPIANGGGITLTGLNFTQGAITNAADSEAITVKQVSISGAAGVALETGVYSWTGIEIVTPAQAANGATNAGFGIKITGGAKAGGASAYQRGLDITMAAATDTAINVVTGLTQVNTLAALFGGSNAITFTKAADAAARTVTFPDATGTVALLGLAQSWSALQTFAAGLSLGSGQLSGNAQVFSNLGTVYIGDTANGNMTLGLTINQGSATDEIISLKSSAIAHGFTALTETDTYGYMKLVSGTDGGIQIGALRETATEVLQLLGVAGADVDTTKSTAGAAIITAYGSQGSGTGFANVVANGNVFALKGRSGGAWSALMIIDIDGDMWLGGTLNAVGAYQVAGVQVVGARVVDARCDDVVNSGDVTTDGVIDALRDAMITHGLIAAA